ncbi:hypothetical protein [Parasitella parasitica]|uniref:Choice-of-anchor A domain-containing protein n=1 Tax=Parasitella parasitica TaxID=35722 RepID=A0A0B7N882_9FUNG|nr:hypothetical protein [Parasitella parasitica]
MTRPLSIVLSVLLVTSTSLVQAIGGRSRMLFLRDVQEDFNQCRGSGWENDMLTRFTGIFFGDFYTGGSQDILGSLAVEGNMHAPNYIVNANHGSDCTNPNSLNSYGLVVGGTIDTFNTHVHGNAFIAGGGTTEEILELDQGCIVTDQEGTGIFDFALVKNLLQSSSEDFANYPATSILESDGSLTELRNGELGYYEILTFNTCGEAACSADPDTESDPNAIFLNIGNWNGVQGSTIDPDKTYVFNIPVKNGATFTMSTNHPSNGFNPCNVIYNVYPVDDNGAFMADGEFTFIRKTSNQLGGFVLAPRGHIVDGSTGNFAGTIVGKDYTWENLNAGVEIHDYASAGGNCDQYLGCIPNHVTTTPSITVTPTTTTTTSKSRTRTWSTTISINTSSLTRFLFWKQIAIPTIGIDFTARETTTETVTRTTSTPMSTTVIDTTYEQIVSVPITLETTLTTVMTMVTTDSDGDPTVVTTTSTEVDDITSFSGETTTVTELTSTIYSDTTVVEETTETFTTTETLETFSDTTCIENSPNVVTVGSTKTETVDEVTDSTTVTQPGKTTTLTVTTDIFTTTETDSVFTVTDYETTTRKKFLIDRVTRTVTECDAYLSTCATVTIGGGEDSKTYDGKHYGHHHGYGEECNEEDEEDYDDDKYNNKD